MANAHSSSRILGAARGNLSLSLPLIYPRRIALAVMFMMTTRVFYYFPGMSIPSEGWNVLCFLFLCFVYLSWKVRNGGRFIGLETYVLILMVAMPVWSGIMAQHVFGQPFFYGFLSRRPIICATGGLALLMFYRAGWIKSADCRQAFLIMAWVTLALYTFFELFLQARESAGHSGPQVKLFYGFELMGFFYYGLIGFAKKSKVDYALAALFFMFIISTGQRALLLTAVGTYGLFVLLRGSFARLIVFVPASLCGIAAIVSIFYFANPEFTTNLAIKLGEAVTVVTTGNRTADASSNARIEETALVAPYMAKSLLLGNGDISNHWEGGYPNVLHGYFFPSDVGLIGSVYMFGVLGTLLFFLQFWWARRYAKGALRGPKTDADPMANALVAFLIAYAVISLTTGWLMFNFQSGILAITYLYIVCDERKIAEGLRHPVARRFPYAALRGSQDKV